MTTQTEIRSEAAAEKTGSEHETKLNNGSDVPPDDVLKEKPPFTYGDIKRKIPAHCFERSTTTFLFYTLSNVGSCLLLFYLATWIDHLNLPNYARNTLWISFWIAEGLFMSGLWVICHECVHYAGSDIKIVNDIIGVALHSVLLTPFHSWRESHLRHHRHTGNYENDENWVPLNRKLAEKYWPGVYEETNVFSFIRLIILVMAGWYAYLITNIGGPREKYPGKNVNHYSFGSVFCPKNAFLLVISNSGVIAWSSLLVYMAYTHSFKSVFVYYFMPLLVCTAFFMLITLLQHTDTYVPHIHEESWSWLWGSLCTVDRSYGKVLDAISHHLGDTHICHHLFPRMPFYHAVEATKAIKEAAGPYYVEDKTPILKALWRIASNCKFLDENDLIAYWKRS